MIEELLAAAEPGCPRTDYRRLPGLSRRRGVHPARRRLRVQLGRLADRRRPQPPRARPTSTATTTRRAPCTGQGWEPPTPPSCWPSSTSTAPDSARCSTAAADRRSALRVSNDVQRRWRSFSRTGVPGDDWPPYTRDDRAVMVFDRRAAVEFDPHADRRQAWEGFSLAR